MLNIRNVKTYTAATLSNEDYHADTDHVSGSTLCAIYHECPAAWRYAEESESPALHFGIASHAAMLEPEKFDAEFACDIDASRDDVIASDAAIKAWLKDKGVQVKSTASFSDLCKLVVDTGEKVCYLKMDSLAFESECKFNGQTIVKYDDYQKVLQMRKVIYANTEYAEMLKGAKVECSVYAEIEIDVDGESVWVGVKIRPDIITKNFEVPDFKTTANPNPEAFGRQAHDAGYWLKMAFQHDILEAVKKGQSPRMGLLAQGKKAPYIPQLYWLTDQQLEVGREQYMYALATYYKCKQRDVWPAYFSSAVDLPTPGYIASRYGFDNEEIEISFEE